MDKPILAKRVKELEDERAELLDEVKLVEKSNQTLRETIQQLEAGQVETKPKKKTRIFGDPIVDIEW